MRCERCGGTGVVSIIATQDEKRVPMVPAPCPQCGGSGVDYCCSGDVNNAVIEGDDL